MLQSCGRSTTFHFESSKPGDSAPGVSPRLNRQAALSLFGSISVRSVCATANIGHISPQAIKLAAKRLSVFMGLFLQNRKQNLAGFVPSRNHSNFPLATQVIHWSLCLSLRTRFCLSNSAPRCSPVRSRYAPRLRRRIPLPITGSNPVRLRAVSRIHKRPSARGGEAGIPGADMTGHQWRLGTFRQAVGW